MNKDFLKEQWIKEEIAAHIQGWDFLHIHGRYEEEHDLPWDFRSIISQYIKPKDRLLDIDTGGGEFLLSLKHPNRNTSSTEAYPPNVKLCKEVLLPLGIDFHQANGAGTLPFKNNTFDVVINRHGAFNALELFRVLAPEGVFITEQVGAENDREFIDMLLPSTNISFPDLYLKKMSEQFMQTGFEILQEQEAFRPIKFYDIGALVWFAHIIEWEFPNFTVDRCLPKLFNAQQVLEERGCIEGIAHRFLIVARKVK
jgi:SAM-dependent methyltransferase